MFGSNCLRITGALLLLAFAGTLQAQKLIEVYPTGLYPDDVKRVHVALESLGDGGDGIILMKSSDESGNVTAFNFGTDADPTQRGQVVPRADWGGAIEFRGEQCRDRHTVIEGGHNTIATNRHDRITVSGIEFRGAYGSAIFITEASGAEIVNNVFIDSVGNFENTIVAPIRFRSNVSGSRTEIVGLINIRNNRVEGGAGWFTYGMALTSTNAGIVIADNEMRGVNVGISLGVYQQSASVYSNEIFARVPRAGFFSAGMEIYPGEDSTASINISANHIAIVDVDDNGSAYGILATAYSGDFRNSLIYGNVIETKNVYVGIALTIDGENRYVNGNIVARNTVLGSVPYGVALYVDAGSGRIEDNRVTYNHLSGMTPGFALSHVWLDQFTRNTLCAVEAGNIVTDYGINNVIIM